MNKIWVSVILLLLLAACSLTGEDRFFDSAGIRIHYVLEGKGEPVVLIHGFAVDLAMNWAEPGIIKRLAGRYQVIAVDNRGHGRSDKPHDPRQYGINMVADVARLLDHLGIRSAHIVGYSMGGRIANAFLTDHPERVRSAVLGGTPWLGADGLAAREAQANELAESLEQGRGFAPSIARLTPRDEPPSSAKAIEAHSKMMLERNDAFALAAVERGTARLFPAEAKLRANRVPVLAIVGERDTLKNEVNSLVSVLGNAKLVVIPGANHMTAFARPEFLAAVEEFLKSHENR